MCVTVLAAVQVALIVRTVRARRVPSPEALGDAATEGGVAEVLWVMLPGVLLALLLTYSVTGPL